MNNDLNLSMEEQKLIKDISAQRTSIIDIQGNLYRDEERLKEVRRERELIRQRENHE